MLVAMVDVVLGWGLLASVWLGGSALLLDARGLRVAWRATGRPCRSMTRAMDGVGGILMAALLVLMSGDGAASSGGHGVHGAHGGSSSALIWAVVAASVLFAAASVR